MRRISTLAVTAAAAAALSLASPAHAESQRFSDPRGDAVDSSAAFGAKQAADILRTTGKHEQGRFRVAVDVVDLSADEFAGAFLRMRVPNGTEYGVQAFRVEGDKEFGLSRMGRDGESSAVECDDLSVGFSNAKDKITVTVPRSCLRKPRWIRFGVVTLAANPRTERSYLDDARRDGFDPTSDQIRLGTKQLRHN